jgi:hypothetical protein
MKKKALVLALAGLMILFLAGPTPKIDVSLKPIHLPADLDHCLAHSEAKFSDLVPSEFISKIQ